MDPRTLCIFGMLAFAATGVANALYFGSELRRFLRATPTIESSHDIERFKEVVAHQMMAALAQIVLLAAPPLIFFAGLFKQILQPPDIVFVIVPSVVVIAVASVYRRWEREAKTIRTSDRELEAERNAVIRTWMRKPWPDW